MRKKTFLTVLEKYLTRKIDNCYTISAKIKETKDEKMKTIAENRLKLYMGFNYI